MTRWAVAAFAAAVMLFSAGCNTSAPAPRAIPVDDTTSSPLIDDILDDFEVCLTRDDVRELVELYEASEDGRPLSPPEHRIIEKALEDYPESCP